MGDREADRLANRRPNVPASMPVGWRADAPADAHARDSDPALLEVPPGAMVVLIGPAGSGKSTLAAKHIPPDAVLSSDAFRAQTGRGEADQSVTGAAFAALHRALERRLAGGRTTVVDATSLTRRARLALLDRARRANAVPVALVLDLPAELMIARNATRIGRVVPDAAVQQQLALMRLISDDDLMSEGFAVVRRLRSPEEVAGLRLMSDLSRS